MRPRGSTPSGSWPARLRPWGSTGLSSLQHLLEIGSQRIVVVRHQVSEVVHDVEPVRVLAEQDSRGLATAGGVAKLEVTGLTRRRNHDHGRTGVQVYLVEIEHMLGGVPGQCLREVVVPSRLVVPPMVIGIWAKGVPVVE